MRSHVSGEAVEKHLVHDQLIWGVTHGFRCHHIVHIAFHGGDDHIAAHEALIESHHPQIIIFGIFEQFGDVGNVHDGVACFVGAVEAETGAVVLHDEGVVVGGAGFHAPVEESAQSGGIAGIPLFPQLKVGAVHVSRGIGAVKVEPLYRHGAAGAVDDFSHPCIAPVAFGDAVLF